MLTEDKLTKEDIKTANNLRNFLINEYNIDILNKTREGLYPAYRALFNTILTRKYKFRKVKISKYYRFMGWNKKSHATVINSLTKFKLYKRDFKEIENLFYELYPIAKSNAKQREFLKFKMENQNELQKLISTIPKERRAEIIELITLRKKSWEWKSKDSVKIYTGAFA